MTNSVILVQGAGLSLHYNKQLIINNISITIKSGTLTALMAPSGSGKSTLLRIMLGLEQPDTGTITLFCNKKDIAVVFQDVNLLPWLSAEENYTFLCESSGKEVNLQDIERWLNILNLRDRRNYFPHKLSGGMRQKVALMRALLLRPKILYLDEALDEIDEMSRFTIFDCLRNYCKQSSASVLSITHNPLDALHLCDEVLVGGHCPMQIMDKFRNPLPADRSYQWRFSLDFFKAAEKLSSCLYQA